MDQSKIGQFIAEQRKRQKLTQAELAEKLGVTDKSVGNWENGRNLPDVSLFEPLCKELGITINDLLSGEKINEEKYQEKLEENMINTINYTKMQLDKKNNIIGGILILLGILISLIDPIIFQPEEIVTGISLILGWIGILIGWILSIMGIVQTTKKWKMPVRLLLIMCFFLLYFCILFTINSLGIIRFNFSFYI